MRTLVLAAALVGLAGCTSSGAVAEPTPVSVTISDTACDLAPTSAQAGTIVFSVRNAGSEASGFGVYGASGDVVGELSGIGPGEARDLVLAVQAGQYEAVCTRERIRTAFEVTVQ